jgi:hypothetical protein
LSGAADLLTGWRAWRAARDVATVAAAPEAVATAPNPQKTTIVASVATVAERHTAERAAEAWPDGFLYLSGRAVALDVAIRAGATVARCPTGALDVTLPDGRLWLLSPALVLRLNAAGLLPENVPAQAGRKAV